MNRKIVFFLAVVWAITLMLAGRAFAGSLDAPGVPGAGSGMPTVTDIYNQLDTGATSTPAAAFQEPSSGPTAGTGKSLSDIKLKLPVPDNTNGATVADVFSGKTFWGLRTDGTWGLKTGTNFVQRPPAVVQSTGQAVSYAAGDDGDLKYGAAFSPRFTDNGNGTVTDNLTGLIWLQNANCFGFQVWATALNSANTLASGACGLTDGSTAGAWRLPNRSEIKSLVDYSIYSPALPTGHLFTNVQFYGYWSSTTFAYYTDIAWVVYMYDGGMDYLDKFNISYVWPVRGGQ